MTYEELNDLLWDSIMLCLGLNTANADDIKKVRREYPAEGSPAWKVSDNIVFYSLDENQDNYARQVDSTYEAGTDTVYKKSTRTRYWALKLTAYGPAAYENLNIIKDMMLSYKVKKLLATGKLYIVPQQLPMTRAPELFAGQWWNRWDCYLFFNEHYILPDEDVGRIEYVSINTRYNP